MLLLQPSLQLFHLDASQRGKKVGKITYTEHKKFGIMNIFIKYFAQSLLQKHIPHDIHDPQLFLFSVYHDKYDMQNTNIKFCYQIFYILWNHPDEMSRLWDGFFS